MDLVAKDGERANRLLTSTINQYIIDQLPRVQHGQKCCRPDKGENALLHQAQCFGEGQKSDV
jgi:hypothetical protein